MWVRLNEDAVGSEITEDLVNSLEILLTHQCFEWQTNRVYVILGERFLPREVGSFQDSKVGTHTTKEHDMVMQRMMMVTQVCLPG